MPDVYDTYRNHPKFETSREPKYEHISFYGYLEDDMEDSYEYEFSGAYYYFEGMLRVVDATVTTNRPLFETVSQLELQNMIAYDIRSELKVSLRESIIFESQIELK